ncbi:MAG: HEAT repeat domain-containing protein [Pirellulales bacterium]
MHKTRTYTICAALVAVALATVDNPVRAVEGANAADAKEGQLIGVLQSDAPKSEKAITCKRLAVYGTKKAVPALAALLPDAELTSWSRIALEAIPDPAADAALRDALGKLDGQLLIGVINSIGVRRDAGAVDGLARRLGDVDAAVASAAAVALGRIGNEQAVEHLEPSLADAPASVRSAAAIGCILCAERLLVQGKRAEAVRLYDMVRKADLPEQRIIEATRGAILARKSAGVPLLVEQLRSNDQRRFNLGLTTARELPGREVTEALVAELGAAAPDRQALLIRALADRNDPAALPAVLRAAQSGPNSVRTVAMQVLARVGNASCLPTLLEIAGASDAEIREAAKAAVVGLPDDQVDADLIAHLARDDSGARTVLIELAGRRRIVAATAMLIKAADDSDPHVRSAALTALGSTVGPRDLSVLITRVVAPRQPEDRPVAEKALRAASVRMPDREACADELAAAMADAPLSAKRTVVEILGAVGGTKGLAAVADAAKDKNPELRDVASRLLGQWMTADAAPVLLELAKSDPEAKYQIRALRGYIRIARQFVLPNRQRAKMCRAALETAKRDAEKILVLQVLQRYPSVEMLEVAVEASKDPSLKAPATKTANAIAQKVGTKSPRVQKLLSQIGSADARAETTKAK